MGHILGQLLQQLYVTDSGVCMFNRHDTYLREFGWKSSAHVYGRRFDPTCIHIDHNRVYITEYSNSRVSVFDTDGKYLSAVGDRPESHKHCHIVINNQADAWSECNF